MLELIDSFDSRSILLYSENNIKKIKNAAIAIIGLGGVGGSAFELLVRAGAENLFIYDFDSVSVSNLNRQILFTTDDIGKKKTDCAVERAAKINPQAKISKYSIFLNANNLELFKSNNINFVIEAGDFLYAKTSIIYYLLKNKITFISALGAGGRTDITKIKIDYLENTTYCGFAKQLRGKLKKNGILIKKNIPVVYSTEIAIKPVQQLTNGKKKFISGTASHITNTFGAYCVDYCLKFICNL